MNRRRFVQDDYYRVYISNRFRQIYFAWYGVNRKAHEFVSVIASIYISYIWTSMENTCSTRWNSTCKNCIAPSIWWNVCDDFWRDNGSNFLDLWSRKRSSEQRRMEETPKRKHWSSWVFRWCHNNWCENLWSRWRWTSIVSILSMVVIIHSVNLRCVYFLRCVYPKPKSRALDASLPVLPLHLWNCEYGS